MLLVAFAASASAYDDILLISDSLAPGDDPTGDHCDDALVAFLQDIGYSVDTSGMNKAYQEGNNPFADPAKVNTLKGVGLVLVSRRTNSGAYDNDRKNWNELANPLILCSAYLTRGETSSKRWGWTTGGSGDVADKTTTDMEWDPPAHPFVPHTMFDWTGAGGQSPKGPYLPIVSGGETVAGTILGTFDDQPWLVDIDAGTDLDAINNTSAKYGVTGDNRVFMGAWGYDTPGTYEWGDFMTIEYKALLSQVIREKIPEPMTLTLLGLGGLALVRRRKM
jgi:hypothetical protein